MKDFNHPNVLSLIGVVLNDQQMPMVIIPYMSRGDLKQVLKDDSWVSSSNIVNMKSWSECGVIALMSIHQETGQQWY